MRTYYLVKLLWPERGGLFTLQVIWIEQAAGGLIFHSSYIGYYGLSSYTESIKGPSSRSFPVRLYLALSIPWVPGIIKIRVIRHPLI